MLLLEELHAPVAAVDDDCDWGSYWFLYKNCANQTLNIFLNKHPATLNAAPPEAEKIAASFELVGGGARPRSTRAKRRFGVCCRRSPGPAPRIWRPDCHINHGRSPTRMFMPSVRRSKGRCALGGSLRHFRAATQTRPRQCALCGALAPANQFLKAKKNLIARALAAGARAPTPKPPRACLRQRQRVCL